MAGRKKEAQVQQTIDTQEEWEEYLTKEGLIVVDVYQEWCGPCVAMQSNLKRLKLDLSDDLLHLAVAKADTIDALEKYRGKCEPCFLFFAGGSLVSVIRGANAPKLMKTITEELAQEHRVLDGSAERKEIRDPLIMDDEREKGGLDEEETEKEEEIPKEVTVAIIKPDAVKAGKVEEILEKMREQGIEILAEEEKQLTDEEAREFYSEQKDSEHFEKLIEFMSSGPSHVLVLSKGTTGENFIQEWRDLLGPTLVEEAKENAPDSLRAMYGTESMFNALHGSDSKESATRELAFFFPHFAVPTVPAGGTAPKKPQVQRTLALIRPDALVEHKDAIIEKIKEAGFSIAMHKEVQLSKEQAEQFYKEHKDQPYFEELTTRMSSGPLLALGLARDDAVTAWRDMLGPKEVDKAKEEAPDSLRATFAVEGVDVNPLHGSDSIQTAQEELNYFFPMEQTVAVIKPDAYQSKDEIMDKIKEAGFHIAARKETELTKDMVEQFYVDHKDKEYFMDLAEHMTSGPTLFMVLSREDAVSGWRGIIGPTDPDKAKEEAPDSIRAQYGTDIKANAVHGASTAESAKEVISQIFGEMEFNPDGSVKGDELEGGDEKEEEGAVKDEEAAQGEEGEKTEGEETAPATEDDPSTPDNKETEEDVSENDRPGSKAESERPSSSKSNSERPDSSKSSKEIGQTTEAVEGEQTTTESQETEAEKPAETAEGGGDEQKYEEEKPAESTETEEAEKKAADGEAAEEKKEGEEETPAATEEAPAATEEAPAATEEAPAATEDAPAGTEEGEKTEEAPSTETAEGETPATEEKPAEAETEGGEEKAAADAEAPADAPAEGAAEPAATEEGKDKDSDKSSDKSSDKGSNYSSDYNSGSGSEKHGSGSDSEGSQKIKKRKKRSKKTAPAATEGEEKPAEGEETKAGEEAKPAEEAKTGEEKPAE